MVDFNFVYQFTDFGQANLGMPKFRLRRANNKWTHMFYILGNFYILKQRGVVDAAKTNNVYFTFGSIKFSSLSIPLIFSGDWIQKKLETNLRRKMAEER